MIMALDDACLACCSSTLYDVEEKTVNDIHSSVQTFLRKYEALNSDELAAALMVNFNDLIGTLSNEVTCVGCRRSVECMLQKLHDSGDSALEPLVITDDKVISVNRDHLLTPQALANLFCNQLHRLKTAYIEPITGEFSQWSKIRKVFQRGDHPKFGHFPLETYVVMPKYQKLEKSVERN